MKKHLLKIVLLCLLFVYPCIAEEEPFIRVDRDDFDAWSKELDNVRFLEEERMSGSAQFSEAQFHDLAIKLKEKSDEVWIIDCRQESHGLINDAAVSWCGENNLANQGKAAEEIEEEEESFSGLIGTTVMEYTSKDDLPQEGKEVLAEKWETERELVENEGFHYLRLDQQLDFVLVLVPHTNHILYKLHQLHILNQLLKDSLHLSKLRYYRSYINLYK